MLYLFYTTKKMSHFTAKVTKMTFFGCNSQVYYDSLHNRLSTDFQSMGNSFQRSIVMVFKETKNDDFILPSKTCQRHLSCERLESHQEPQTSGN